MISKLDYLISILPCYSPSQLGILPKIPGCTGFHNLTGPPANPLDVSHVPYLPCIKCTPMELRAVNEILKQENSKADNLWLEFADLVLNHAI